MNQKIKGKDPYIIFQKPKIDQDDINRVIETLQSGWIGKGPMVEKFEQDFAHYKKIEHALALNSCTAALHLSLEVLQLPKGSEVITTPMTFCATTNAILHAGHRPIFADVEENTLNIDPQNIIEKITPKTKALLIVHFAGQACAMDEIMSIAKKHGLYVIEDAAHAVEGNYHNIPLGTIGDLGCFSFYATKNITTAEGGMLVSKDEKMLRDAQVLSLHGLDFDAWKRYSGNSPKTFDIKRPGYKYNMADLQAALAIGQLKRIESLWKRRQEIWKFYYDALKEMPVSCLEDIERGKHSYHLFPIFFDKGNLINQKRDKFMLKMHDDGIGTGIHYKSLTSYEFYQKELNLKENDCPIASLKGETTVSLPISSHMTDIEIERVVKSVKKNIISLKA